MGEKEVINYLRIKSHPALSAAEIVAGQSKIEERC
jgi:hypothetical protein